MGNIPWSETPPKVDLDKLRRSGAFVRVVEVNSALVYLQVTENPLDDLTEGFEEKLAVARGALALTRADARA